MSYVDGFVMVVPKKNLKAYERLARIAGKIWREHGALDYRECVGDDLKTKCGVSFQRLVKAKPSEAVIFSFIVYKSRSHRDKVNAKVMNDKRLLASLDGKKLPFDMERMSHGGSVLMHRLSSSENVVMTS